MCDSGNTSSSSASKFKCVLPHSSFNCIHFFYFNHVVRIMGPSLLTIILLLPGATIYDLLLHLHQPLHNCAAPVQAPAIVYWYNFLWYVCNNVKNVAVL